MRWRIKDGPQLELARASDCGTGSHSIGTMFNSQQYPTKAAEYRNRASKTDNPSEIREFKHLDRTFGELADNAEWMEKNSDQRVHAMK
jgi:hypothetical protein